MVSASEISGLVEASLWVGTAGMFIGMLYFITKGWGEKNERMQEFFIVTTFIAAIAFVNYLAMALGYGVTEVMVDGETKVIYWARYTDWFFTTPLLLLDLGLLAGATRNELATLVGLDAAMIGRPTVQSSTPSSNRSAGRRQRGGCSNPGRGWHSRESSGLSQSSRSRAGSNARVTSPLATRRHRNHVPVGVLHARAADSGGGDVLLSVALRAPHRASRPAGRALCRGHCGVALAPAVRSVRTRSGRPDGTRTRVRRGAVVGHWRGTVETLAGATGLYLVGIAVLTLPHTVVVTALDVRQDIWTWPGR